MQHACTRLSAGKCEHADFTLARLGHLTCRYHDDSAAALSSPASRLPAGLASPTALPVVRLLPPRPPVSPVRRACPVVCELSPPVGRLVFFGRQLGVGPSPRPHWVRTRVRSARSASGVLHSERPGRPSRQALLASRTLCPRYSGHRHLTDRAGAFAASCLRSGPRRLGGDPLGHLAVVGRRRSPRRRRRVY